jgi:hypothetical protein
MVNHFVLTDEELVDELIDLIECSVEVDYDLVDNDFDINTDCSFHYKRNREYHEIRKELLYRLSK